MSKYTMLFSEWLEGGGILPAAFDNEQLLRLVPDAKEIFIAYYADKELGFETTELFELKFNLKAEQYIPWLLKMNTEYNTTIAQITIPRSLSMHSRQGERINTNGPTDTEYYERPIVPKGGEATPDQVTTITKTAEVTNSERYNGYTETVSNEKTNAEMLDTFKYQKDIYWVLSQKLIDGFEDLFMQVY